jgi:Zn-dependent M28 family amino/carboxypeptidase
LRSRLAFYGGILTALLVSVLYATVMPGSSYSGPLPTATGRLRDLQKRLREHVTQLAGTIGTRNVDKSKALTAAREYITGQLKPLEAPSRRVELEGVGVVGGNAENVLFEVAGRQAKSVVLVGAHYDSCEGGPGANDNGSGVAAALELAAAFADTPAKSAVRFVFFANEEPPYFKNPGMGSRVNANNARRRQDPISAMLSLETIGYYSDAADSQHYPWPVGLLYPSRGNFLGFVGDLGSRSLLRSAIASFRLAEQFPSEGAALPSFIPGVDWSDHWSFRQAGYPAIMITDTAVYRDPSYHRASDTPAQLDYDRLARVTCGIEAVVRELADASPSS